MAHQTLPHLHQKAFRKPDGRDLFLYSRQPISDQIVPTCPKVDGQKGEPHLRWHPLRGEWVAFASHRQNRTFLPPKEYNPLAPTTSSDFPTELPAGDYDIAVFENLFTSLDLRATAAPPEVVPTRPGIGRCEVVVFTKDPDSSLGQLSLPHLFLLLKTWADRYREIPKLGPLQYVLPFENRGVEMGVTLNHPHGQIYSYPFVPPVPAQMTQTQLAHFEKSGTSLLGDLLTAELKNGSRVIHEGRHSAAIIPAFARYPYEVWVAPKRAVPSLADMNDEELFDFGKTLKTVLMKFDALWNRPFPYLMALYAAPSDGKAHPEWHFHIEFYPPYRTKDRLKYLAGTELAAGMFVNDSLPEAKAAELKNISVQID